MGQKDNPLPEEDDDAKLTEQFGEFFLNKIINIWKLFHNIPPYETQKGANLRFDKFSIISKADLKTIINQMPNKSCQLDILQGCQWSGKSQGKIFSPGQGKVREL